MVGDMTTKKDIKAHSPRYSMNIGRVASRNAGVASIAVAIPALSANFKSRSFMREPSAHNVCFTLPKGVKLDHDGVCIVSGACGRIFGKEG
jgi:hypothetical protein